MRKTLIILTLALSLSPAFAQKRSLVLGNVTGSSGVGGQEVEKLKSGILEGLTTTGRLDVTDGASIDGLSRKTSEALIQLAAVNVQYYMEANLETVTTSTSYSDGKTSYNAKMEYAYQVYDLATGAVLYNGKNSHSGSSSNNSEEAVLSSFSSVDNDIISMVNNIFRVRAEIKAVNETHPKKGIRSVYISAGSSDGVAAGNAFEIFKIMDVAGEQITEKIGEMKVAEVKNANLSLCKVTKGGKELQAAMDDEVPVTVVSCPPPTTAVDYVVGGAALILGTLL